MYGIPNRRERKKLAKQMGLKGKETHEEWLARIKRAQAAGQQIHALNLAEQEFNERQSDEGGNARVVDFQPEAPAPQVDESREEESLDDFGI